MSIPIRAGVLLGVLCVFWTFVMGFTGWYKDPVMLNLFFLVILLEVGIVIWALRKTARERHLGRPDRERSRALAGGQRDHLRRVAVLHDSRVPELFHRAPVGPGARC